MSAQILSVASPAATAPAAEKLAVGQFLALAASANVFFEVINDRLVVRAVNPRWDLWHGVRVCLDELGVEKVEDYLRHTTERERAELSSAA